MRITAYRRALSGSSVLLIASMLAGPGATSAASAPAATDLRAWRPHVRQATAYAERRAGTVGFAVRSGRRLYGHRARRRALAVSVVKPMLLVSYLRLPDVRDRTLRPADRGMLAPMIRWSSNTAASRVHHAVGGSAGLARLARVAGMGCFRPSAPIWGHSITCAAEQARFFMRIDRYVPRRHRACALRLLAAVVRSQRWGVARERPPGWALYFKGGWGSGSGAVDHQVALLRRGHRRLALAILTTGSPSHAYAKETLRGVAARLLRGLGTNSLPR